jgi:hypothetical protein
MGTDPSPDTDLARSRLQPPVPLFGGRFERRVPHSPHVSPPPIDGVWPPTGVARCALGLTNLPPTGHIRSEEDRRLVTARAPVWARSTESPAPLAGPPPRPGSGGHLRNGVGWFDGCGRAGGLTCSPARRPFRDRPERPTANSSKPTHTRSPSRPRPVPGVNSRALDRSGEPERILDQPECQHCEHEGHRSGDEPAPSPSGCLTSGGASSSTGQCQRYQEHDTRPIIRSGGRDSTRRRLCPTPPGQRR